MAISIRLLTIFFISALALAAAVVFFLDADDIASVLDQARWPAMILAFLFVVISYAAQAIGFWAACRIFKINVPVYGLLEIGFVSNILTNILSTGGIPGQSYRVLTMKHKNVPATDATAVSIFHSYFNNLIFFVMLPFVFWYLRSTIAQTPRQVFALVLAATAFAFLLVISSVIVFSKPVRQWIFAILSAIASLFFPKKKLMSFFTDLDTAFDEGIARGRKKPDLLFLMLALVSLDWGAMIVCLGYCFSAFGPGLAAGKLLAGFVVGISAGVLSLIPGGIGVQDGSMAGIYVLFGATLGQTILALILFRLFFYLIPFGASFFFYKPALDRQKKRFWKR
jgi:uncharacterized protein (TIRG00374 family)